MLRSIAAPWRFTVLFTALAAGALVVAQILCYAHGIEFAALVRDPAAHLQGAAYVGLFSNMGGAAWGCAATLAYFGWAKLRRDPAQRELSQLLLYMALLTTLLGLDDLALLHDHWLPRRLHLPEKIVIPVYGLLALLWLRRYGAILRARVPVPLCLTMVCFSLSVLFDQRPKWGGSTHHLLEDGFKTLGILNWVRTAWELSAGALQPRLPEA